MEIEKMSNMLSRAKKALDRSASRVKNDLILSYGNDEYLSDFDKNAWGENRGVITLNVISALIERSISIYTENPFGIEIEAYTAEQIDESERLNRIIKRIQNDSHGRQVYTSALRSAFACGLGYIHSYTTEENGRPEIRIENLPNPLLVLVDPSSVLPDASDAEYIAYYSKISKQKAKRLYDIPDDEYSVRTNEYLMEVFENEYDSECEYPMVTVYVKEDDTVKMYRCVGNTKVDEIDLQIPNIPIVRVVGAPLWDSSSNSWEYVGIGHRALGVQKLTNFALSQMVERLALSPKANYIAVFKSIAEYKDDWENSSRENPPVLFYDNFDPDNPEEPLPMPQQQRTAVELGDVNSILGQIIGLTEIATGISPNGLFQADTRNKTAEQVLTEEHSSEAVLASIFNNLSESIKTIGEVLVSMIKSYYTIETERETEEGPMIFSSLNIDFNAFKVTVTNGPLLSSERKANVKTLLSLIAALPSDANAIVPTLLDNLNIQGAADIKQRVEQGQINPEEHTRLQQENVQLKLQMNELQQKVLQLQSSEQGKMIQARTQLATTQMNNENKITIENIKQSSEDKRLLAQLESRERVESDKLQADTLKRIEEHERFIAENGVENIAETGYKTTPVIGSEEVV